MVPQTVLNRPTWFYKKEEAGGGIVEDMMAHFFDLLRTLVGPIEGVYAAPGQAWARAPRAGRHAVSGRSRGPGERQHSLREWRGRQLLRLVGAPQARGSARRFRSTARTAACYFTFNKL